MATAAFDTLKAAKQLKRSGFSETQAETLSEVFREVQESHLQTLATKADLTELKGEVVERITKVEGRLTLVQWMLGFNLALSVTVLWLLTRAAGLA